MVGSCGADASVVASWMGWIRTLASVLVVSLGGIVSSAGAMGSDGLRRSEMEWEALCVISVKGFSSLDAWLRGSLRIFTTSLGFAKCFRKPLFILQVIFIAWRSFRSLEIILQPKGKKKNIFATHGKNRNIFAAHFEAWKSFHSHLEAWRLFHSHLEVWKSFGSKRPFSQHMEDLAGGSYGAAKSFRSQMEFSQPGAIFAAHFAAAKWGWAAAKWHSCAKGWFRSCETTCEMGVRLRNFRLALCVHLQMAITSSFQLQFTHRLKRWTPDFLSFETRYSTHEINFGKWSKCSQQLPKWGGANCSVLAFLPCFPLFSP